MLAGLGNPGRKYESTRHNLGFAVIDELARRAGIRVTKPVAQALTGRGRIERRDVILAKPQTYMNLSGQSVKGLLGLWGLGVENLVVIHDDLDIPLGRIKLVRAGGHGGHKGVASIADLLGSRDFVRIKVGIGRPRHVGEEVADFVLRPFRSEDKNLAEESIARSAEAVEQFLSQGLAKTQSLYNCAPEGPEPGA